MPALRLLPSIRLEPRDLRLASGLVLFTYVTLHLGCHALGLVSLPLAEAALAATVAAWRSLPGTMILYGAAAVHVALALQAVYQRRTLRLPPLQLIRIALGLLMPISLITHFVLTRYAYERYGLPADYQRVVGGLWARGAQGLSFGLLAPGWVHGCLGLRFAFGHRPTWQRLRPLLFAIALLLPVLAGLGFVTMGREIFENPAVALSGRPTPTPRSSATLADIRDRTLAVYAAVIAAIVLGRFGRRAVELRRRSVVWLSYPGRRVSVPKGWSVLDASRSFGIAHQSACGGRGRCTTCRVRVTAGADRCPPPDRDELRALGRLRLDEVADTTMGPSIVMHGDEGDHGADGQRRIANPVRLACQLRPTGDIAIEPLLTVAAQRRSVHAPPIVDCVASIVRLVVGFAPAAPGVTRSAHDTLHALRACIDVTQHVAAAHRGVVCHGDGADGWVVFDARRNLDQSMRSAIATADDIALRWTSLASQLGRELDLRMTFRMGLGLGSVVTGPLRSSTDASHRLAALGAAVEEVDRLVEAVARDGHCVMSPSAMRAIGLQGDLPVDIDAGQLTAWIASMIAARDNGSTSA